MMTASFKDLTAALVFISVAAFVAVPNASAACQQAQLTGQWLMTGVWSDEGEVRISTCNFAIAANGAASGACWDDIKKGKGTAMPADFRFRLGTSCQVSFSYRSGDAGKIVTPFTGFINEDRDVVIGTLIRPESKTIQAMQMIRDP